MIINKQILFLVITVLLLALVIISLRHQSRLLFVELQETQRMRDALNIEWGKFLLEEGAWSQHRRVETTAKARLDMYLPQADRIKVIDLNKGKTH